MNDWKKTGPFPQGSRASIAKWLKFASWCGPVILLSLVILHSRMLAIKNHVAFPSLPPPPSLSLPSDSAERTPRHLPNLSEAESRNPEITIVSANIAILEHSLSELAAQVYTKDPLLRLCEDYRETPNRWFATRKNDLKALSDYLNVPDPSLARRRQKSYYEMQNLLAPLLIREIASDPGFAALLRAAMDLPAVSGSDFNFDQLDHLIHLQSSGVKSRTGATNRLSFERAMAEIDKRYKIVEREVAKKQEQEAIPAVVFSAIKCDTANRLLSGLSTFYIDAKTPPELTTLRNEYRRLSSSLESVRSREFDPNKSDISLKFTNLVAQCRSLSELSNDSIHVAIWKQAARTPITISPGDEEKILPDARTLTAFETNTNVKNGAEISNLLAKLTQLRTNERELIANALKTNRAFAILSGYRLNTAKWLLTRSEENAPINAFLAATNSKVELNRGIAHDIDVAFTPIVLCELLADSDWAPLLTEAIRIQFIESNHNDPSILWCADTLLGVSTSSSALPEPWPEGAQALLEVRIPLAEEKLHAITRRSDVPEPVVRSIKMYRTREIMELTANYYLQYHSPDGLSSLLGKIDQTFRELENKRRSNTPIKK